MPSSSSLSSSNPHKKDPYQTLRLSHDASAAQIKAAYRRLALCHHPDRLSALFRRQQQQQRAGSGGGGDGVGSSETKTKRLEEEEEEAREEEAKFFRDATDKFSEITTAYGILSDPVKKKEYDHLYKFGAFDDDDNNNNNNNNNATNGATSRANGNFAAFSKAGGYAYTTDFSGGYYRKSPPPSCGDTASSHRNYRRCESQDSFFDDVLKSPRNDANTSSSSSAGDGNHASHAAPQQTQSQRPIHRTTHTKSKQKGIGFSLAPLGKHLSIHVPSRHEIVMAMSRGERLHNFGTRVTLTSMESKRIHRQDGGERGDGGDGGKNRQRDGSLSLFNCANGEEEVEQEMEPKEGNRVDEQVEDDGKENIRQSVREDYDDDGIRVTDASGNLYGKAKGGTIPTSDDRHGISEKQPSKRRPTRKIVSTTTRFANGTQRVVKRTAYLHSDGTREVVVEENGVERRRYLVDGLSAQESEGGPDASPNTNTPGRKGRDASSSPRSGGTGESDGTNSGKGNGNNGRDRSWYLNIFETCFAPCGGPAMVT